MEEVVKALKELKDEEGGIYLTPLVANKMINWVDKMIAANMEQQALIEDMEKFIGIHERPEQ